VTPTDRPVLRQPGPGLSIKARGHAAGVTVPSLLRCGLMIALLKGALATRGLRWTLGWIRNCVVRVTLRPSSLESVHRVERRVALAAALYPGRALCLEQSLVLYYALRRQGIGAKYCQGIQPYPFLAHAWVEYEGGPINDFPEHVRQFGRLPEQLP
jgi:hypothetical protein